MSFVRVYKLLGIGSSPSCHLCNVIVSLLLAFNICHINSVLVGNEKSFCGKVLTSTGKTVTLKENETLTNDEFENVHIMKLKDAQFEVGQENCQIRICGFTSFGEKKLYDGYLGTVSDYADCYLIKNHNFTTVDLNMILNERFNTSSISCGCLHGNGNDCKLNCVERYETNVWKNKECAILYQETDCYECYFSPIMLATGETYITNNAHHIRSVAVKQGCKVTQNITGLRRLGRFKNFNRTTFTYPEQGFYKGQMKALRSNVESAFLSDPEIFTCHCEEIDDKGQLSTQSMTVESGSTQSYSNVKEMKSNVMSDEENSAGMIVGIVFSVGLLAVGSVFVVLLILRRWKSSEKRSNVSTLNELDGSGKTTTTSFGYHNFDPKSLSSVPYDPKFEIFKDHITQGEVLGAGNFGEVRKGTLEVAVKSVKYNDEICIESLQQEIKILTCLGFNENVVRLVGVCTRNLAQGELYLLTEFCDNGSLKSYLTSVVRPDLYGKLYSKCKQHVNIFEDGYAEEPPPLQISDGTSLEELDGSMFKQFLMWCEQISNGMSYITSRQIVHVDLAARNVLLTHNLTAKIGDFGLSKKMYIKEYVNSEKDSIPVRWVAPESLTESKYSSKSDVWSYGITAWEIFSLGKDPYSEKHSICEILGALLKGDRLGRPQFAPDFVHLKLQDCWKESPEDRPSFTELRDFFANIDVKYDAKPNLMQDAEV